MRPPKKSPPPTSKRSPGSKVTAADSLRLEAERGWAESDRRRARRVKRLRSRGRSEGETAEPKEQIGRAGKKNDPVP